MIFRQLFDSVSSTYTYLLAARPGGEALIVDPVLEKVDRYLKLFDELDVRLVKAVDTHVHADHITGLGRLRDATACVTVMGRESKVDTVSMRVRDGEKIAIDGLSLEAIYTPGHTDDSYSFAMADRVFTGDTLLIRGTGRTDFQNGDPNAQYDSIFGRLLKLPDETLVYPAHDYKGDTVSTIAEERAFNPRLQVKSRNEYVEIMNGLDLPNPKMMDVAVPANLKVGLAKDDPEIANAAVSPEDAAKIRAGTTFVDLREDFERRRDGTIEGSLHVPYQSLSMALAPSGVLANMAKGRDLLLYCAFGERSALALKALKAAGFKNVKHLDGGTDAWAKAKLPLVQPT